MCSAIHVQKSAIDSYSHAYITLSQDWVLRKLNEKRLEALRPRRESSNPEKDTTQLLMHWYDKEARAWAHLHGGSVKQGAFVAKIPPHILGSSRFSGQLANMLVTNAPAGPSAGCSEFESLVNGKCKAKRCHYYASLAEYQTGCVDETHCLISKSS
jgi:hypothetical protein